MSLVEAFITLFVVVNPIAVIPPFMSLTHKFTAQDKRKTALRTGIIIFSLLGIFAFIGDFILDTLRISEAAFRITGGGLLLFLGIDLVRGVDGGIEHKADQEKGPSTPEQLAVYPLAIPFTSGPGAITTVVLFMRRAGDDYMLQGGVIGVIALVALLTATIFWMSGTLSRLLSQTGIQILSRVFGIIVTGLSIQLIIDGIKQAFGF